MTPQTKTRLPGRRIDRVVEQVHVRMPRALYHAVEAKAARWGTSMNGAINVLVDQALDQPTVIVQCPHREASDAA